MLLSMLKSAAAGLNDSGEDGGARIFSGGAVHHSRGQETSVHAHYAWKIHVGLDAPVWVESDGGSIRKDAGNQVVVVPPGVAHRTGAVGWSLAVFFQPGSRKTPWRATSDLYGLGGAEAGRIVDACGSYGTGAAETTLELATALAQLALPQTGTATRVDARVEHALHLIHQAPGTSLRRVARQVGLSLDRLSRLTIRDTGLPLRRHVLWNRVMGFLSSGARAGTLAAAAAAQGFSDHAHMTRTFRQFLGRAPSEFRAPPEIFGRW